MSVKIIHGEIETVVADKMIPQVAYEVVKGLYTGIAVPTGSVVVRLDDRVYNLNNLKRIQFVGYVSSINTGDMLVKPLASGTRVEFTLEN